MHLELRHLRTVRAIHEQGGLARAASVLNITQSALSHQVKALEDQAGVELFTRRAKPMRLSPAGMRLLRLAEATLTGSTQQGVRHAVLRQLVADIGESCNLTTLSGVEVVYLDRIESAFPLQLHLRPGTRVPVHCSASGKLILAHMTLSQRTSLLGSLPLESHTATTLTSLAALEDEFIRIRKVGYAVDAEEFVEGLVCAAVPVFSPDGRSVRCAVALQAPAARMTLAQAIENVPRLHEAAKALARTLV